MKPVRIEIISLVPGLYKFCSACEFTAGQAGLNQARDLGDLNAYPDSLKEDYLYLSGWVREILEKYPERISIQIINAQSLQGFLKSIRHRVFRYPTFIIQGKEKYHGKDKQALDSLIRERLRLL